MKKLFCFMSIVCLLASCSKEPASEPLVVTNAKLAGTWVYDNTTTGVTEVLKFTNNGGFYYTTTLADAAFAGYGAGNYSVSDDVNLTAVGVDKSLDVTITKLSANSFTAKDKVTGESTTYAKLIETIELEYGKSDTPGYSSLVAGSITSYKSHNVKVATVDKTGAITAVAEGITLIDVVASEGTAVVLVKAEGLIPDYAKAIGYTKNEVLAEYGETAAATNEMVLYTADDKFLTFNISKRTKLVEKIAVMYSNKPFSNSELVSYLNTKYYTYKNETSASFFAYTDKATYDASDVKVTFDNGANLVFSYINHDLFEDFSIALGKTMDEVKYMYGVELICDENLSTNSRLVYIIGDEILGYTGVTLMNDVTFSFDSGVVNSIDLSLVDGVKVADVNAFLSEKYVYDAGISSDNQKIYYDYDRKVKVVYLANKGVVGYTSLNE